MMPRGKYGAVPVNLLGFNDALGTEAIPRVTMPAGQAWIVGFPLGIYPLKEFNQCNLRWFLEDMGTDGTFVSITPICSTGFLTISDAGSEDLGLGSFNLLEGRLLEFYDFVTQNLTTPNEDIPSRRAITKTAVDPTVIAGAILGAANTYNRGTDHHIAFSHQYLAFLVEGDAVAGVDSFLTMHLSADLSWA